MDARLSKAELLSRVKVLLAVELESQVGLKAEQTARTEVKQEYGQTRSLDGIAIARAEMARRKRRLGTLTREQELAIENLLLSTATRISELVGRALELHPLTREQSHLSARNELSFFERMTPTTRSSTE